MNILIVNDYAGVAKYGMTLRHFYLAKEFVKLGHNVIIVSASYSHLFKNNPEMEGNNVKEEYFDGVKFIWVKVNKYKSAFSLSRIVKWFTFSFKCFFLKSHLPENLDVVLSSPTAPFSFIPSYFIAKKFNAKLIFEVRDIWPKTLIEVGKKSRHHPFIKLMAFTEKFAVKKCDVLVSNLSNYSEHVKELGITKNVEWISNGIDIDEVSNAQSLSSSIQQIIPKDKFIIGYAGKIGVSNALDELLNASTCINAEDIVFILVGDGQEKSILSRRYNKDNVIFLGAIPKLQVQSFLSYCDVVYIGLKAEPLFKYGVSPNKLFDYMYSAKPIIEAIDAPNSLVVEASCGLKIESENKQQLIDAIQRLKAMSPSERNKLGERGKSFVVSYYSYQSLAKRYLKLF